VASVTIWMPIRRDPIDDAARRARTQMSEVISDACNRRRAAGLAQRNIASALGCSRQLISLLESGGLQSIDPVLLARYCAAVGLDLSVRAFPGGEPLCDAGQLRLIARFSAAIGEGWRRRTEVPVGGDGRDRRAIDLVLERPAHRVGVEAYTRLMDAQEQVRSVILKQQAAGLACMVLVLADTRHNRTALVRAAPTLDPAFPLRARPILTALRSGRPPAANGVILI
jgi:transcriptional regulator with XRE-family HTH domain